MAFDPFNFDDPGMDVAPAGGWDTPSSGGAAAPSGGGFFDGLGQFLGYAGKTYVDVKAADARSKMAYQYSPYGGYYREGMPNGRIANGGSPLLFLLIVGGIVLLAKS
jgi:hypothetical protein